MKTAITRELLESNGYLKFNQKVLGHENAAANFQKRVCSEGHTKYFITVYEYDFSEIKHMDPTAYSVDVQFTRGDCSYNVSFSGETIEHVESIVEEFFVKMGFDNYE